MAEKPLEFSNQQINNLVEGLKALSGYKGDDEKWIVPGLDDNLSWNAAKCQDICERAAGVYQRASKGLAAKHGVLVGMKLTADNAASVSAYIEADAKLLEQKQVLTGLLRFSRKELQKVGVTQPGILKNLLPLLDDK